MDLGIQAFDMSTKLVTQNSIPYLSLTLTQLLSYILVQSYHHNTSILSTLAIKIFA